MCVCLLCVYGHSGDPSSGSATPGDVKGEPLSDAEGDAPAVIGAEGGGGVRTRPNALFVLFAAAVDERAAAALLRVGFESKF